MGRKLNRRTASPAYSTARSVTIRELVVIRLVIETGKYLEMRDIPFADATELDQRNHLKVQRGIIRGMALALTKMYGNGYEPYWSQEVIDVEKTSLGLARRWVSDGRPDDDAWWFARREQLWRSKYDQGAARS